MRHLTVVAALGLLFAPGVVRADDDDCPMDFTRAASGSWSTKVAELIDACLADPACAAGTSSPQTEEALLHPPPSRGPRGAFARGGAVLGARARGLVSGGPTAGDAHLRVGARGEVGWHRGLRACGRTDVDVGERTQGVTALGVAFPHGFWSIGLGFEQDWQVQPALSSPRRWLRRAYTSNRAELGFAVATWSHRDGGASSVVPIRVAGMWRGQSDAMTETRFLQHMRGAMYERVDGGERLEVLPWSVETSELATPRDPATPAEVAIDPTRPAPLPSRYLAQVGLLSMVRDLADGTRLDVAAAMLFTSKPLACRGCQRFSGSLGVDVPRGRDRWQLRVDRSAFLAIDEVVTVEDRITAGYQRPRGRHTVRATGFAAATRTSALAPTATPPSPDPVATGGVSLALDLDLGLGVTMTTELEVARSFYAHLDGSLAPVAEPAARLGLVLARHFGRAADGAH